MGRTKLNNLSDVVSSQMAGWTLVGEDRKSKTNDEVTVTNGTDTKTVKIRSNKVVTEEPASAS